jgi:hypothetical protein
MSDEKFVVDKTAFGVAVVVPRGTQYQRNNREITICGFPGTVVAEFDHEEVEEISIFVNVGRTYTVSMPEKSQIVFNTSDWNRVRNILHFNTTYKKVETCYFMGGKQTRLYF